MVYDLEADYQGFLHEVDITMVVGTCGEATIPTVVIQRVVIPCWPMIHVEKPTSGGDDWLNFEEISKAKKTHYLG